MSNIVSDLDAIEPKREGEFVDLFGRDMHYAKRVELNRPFEPEPGWPHDEINGRLLCTPDKPMPAGAGGLWSHRAYKIDRESSDGEVEYCSCESCGAEWKVVYEE